MRTLAHVGASDCAGPAGATAPVLRKLARVRVARVPPVLELGPAHVAARVTSTADVAVPATLGPRVDLLTRWRPRVGARTCAHK